MKFVKPYNAAGDGTPYGGLRAQLLATDPAEAGIAVADGAVWGAFMDMGAENGVATLVGLADGTTSLYTTTGGAVIGAGAHEHVRTATAIFLKTVAAATGEFGAVDVNALPRADFVLFVALRAGEAPIGRLIPERELLAMTHALSHAYVAAHDVITQLRLLDESRQQ
ncbi:MAG: hypothetical protein JWM93_3891 [Frankiales bacterium]|nr:hypothetical protein [Frankiales bacterium]